MRFDAEHSNMQLIGTMDLSPIVTSNNGDAGSHADTAWRVRLELSTDPSEGLNVRLTGDVVLGSENGKTNVIDFSPFNARELGVSRRHAWVWTTGTGLFAVDLHSTNGTTLNGEKLKPGTPYQLCNGDVLSLGRLELVVRIIRESEQKRIERSYQTDLSSAVMEMAKAITSQLDLEEVIDRALATAMALTAAEETTIWLVDEKTSELFLEAERGIEDERVRLMRLPVSDPHVRRVFDTGQPLRARRSPDGDPVKVKTGYVVEALLYVPLVTGGRVLGVLAAAQRQPGRKFNARAERNLVAIADFVAIALDNARLYDTVLQADRIKQEMIQNISHEYRTPLHLIIGYLGLALEDTASMSPEIANYFQVVMRQADRLKWLTENIVSLTSVEARAAQRTKQDVISLLAQCVDDACIQANEQGINLNFESMLESANASVNEMAFSQIMSNLLSNAIKFTPSGGEIVVRAERASTGEDVLISVADTGIGIPTEAHEFIFDRFVQLDGSTSRQYEGVGLGLSVVKTLVEAHGGVVWVESAPGEGATFFFTLPVAE
jgi:signal transduction histidine kinase